MPGPLPDGEPVPRDGSLPDSARRGVGDRGFGVYVHVPFCASRCGYCDFNTYTATELGGGASRAAYPDTVLAELALAARVLADTPPPRIDTVFVGGGTPTLLDPDELGRILDGIDKTWGLSVDAEITTEANPESVTPDSLRALRRAGYTRISLGMQSAAPERARRPGPQAHRGAGAAGRRRGARGGLRTRQPGSDLRDAGGERRRLRRLPRRGDRRRGRPRQRVRPDRRGRHRDGRPDAPRRVGVPQ